MLSQDARLQKLVTLIVEIANCLHADDITHDGAAGFLREISYEGNPFGIAPEFADKVHWRYVTDTPLSSPYDDDQRRRCADRLPICKKLFYLLMEKK